MTNYFNSKRIEWSIELLKKYPDYTLEAICLESGFTNLRSYMRLFKDKMDMTPGEYRKILLNTDE